MPQCAVLSCKNYSRYKNKQNSGVSFHKFPNDPYLKDKWIIATGRYDWFPQKHDRICSDHFEAECFDKRTRSQRRHLSSNAIPTLKLHPMVNSSNTNELQYPADVPPAKRRKISADSYYVEQANEASHVDTISNLISSMSLQVQPETTTTPDIQDTPRRRKLKLSVMRAQLTINRQRLQVKRLREFNRRLSKKVAKMENIIKYLREQSVIPDEDITTLESTNVNNDHLEFNRKRVYSKEVRSFALTLHYYSPKAYNYVRKKFNTSLPHPRTLLKWYESVDANAGFTTESLTAINLKQKASEYKILCSLMLDEMAIRKRIEWDGKQFHGYVDIGSNINSDDLKEAREALVFLVNAINANWKVPVGFFFVDGVNGEQRANLVMQCLKLLHNTGVEVVTLTCDGCPANISMLRQLGCNFNPDNMKTHFEHPETKLDVYAFLDPCHMLKLIRNAFQFNDTFVDKEDRKVQWQHLKNLHEIQEKEHLHLANKLGKEHIDFEKNKMKVKLASQLFSNSVADALTFCETQLQLEYFTNVAGTACFIKTLNSLFDVLNSKSCHQKGFKKPLNSLDKVETFQFLDNTKEYLNSLLLQDGTRVVQSSRKMGFVGFLACIESAKNLYTRIVEETEALMYIPMYKVSQDHLELLFCNMRSHGGANNNPTARQFRAIYKKILVHIELSDSGKGNCIPLEEISILNCSSAVDVINNTTVKNKLLEEGENEIDLDEYLMEDILSYGNLSEFSAQITAYIAGHVVRFLTKKLKCDDCVAELHADEITMSHKIIQMKNKGGLTYPSKDVITVCQKAEQVIKNILGSGYIKSKHTQKYITTHALHLCLGIDLFENLSIHQFDQEPMNNHSIQLIKAIMEKYADIRLQYLTNKRISSVSIRSHSNKNVLFMGQ